MAVLKMKLVNIAGPIQKFEEVMLKYVINKDMHLEDAHSILGTVRGLLPFIDENIYDNEMNKLDELNNIFKVEAKKLSVAAITSIAKDYDNKKSFDYIKNLEQVIENHDDKIQYLNKQIKEKEHIINQMVPLINLDINIDDLFHFDFVKFRFGRLSSDNYRKLKRYIRELNVFTVTTQVTDEYVWLSYFMPASISEKVDSIFASLYFERIYIEGGINGKPVEVQDKLKIEIEEIKKKIEEEKNIHSAFMGKEKNNFNVVLTEISYLYQVEEAKVYSAHTLESFYIVAWAPEKEAKSLVRKLRSDESLMYILEDPDDVTGSEPPTKLKNSKLIAPFELIVRMYGIPTYNTIDPTMFVALTFIIYFGMMFGDVGQGLLFLFTGLFIWLVKKKGIGIIVTAVGASCTTFGLLYGSFFGNEEVIRPLWASPMRNINAVLSISIGFGVFLIVVAMIFNIINKIKTKQYEKLFFDKNGIAGFVFYTGIIILILNFAIKGEFVAPIIFILFFFVLPLSVIFFEKKLAALIEKGKHNVKMSFVESFFELFEAILGFASNTISFVRLGAFALSHAGLSLAIWTLYDMVSGGASKVIVLILGNVLIIALEGLIVGIQCLRLEYYEMFSRFFDGNGHEFVSQNIGKEREE